MRSRSLLVIIVLAFSIGCGQDGIPRFEVSGEVMYDGQPVPSGRIVFQPNRMEGNQGPSSTAMISQGKFSTPTGKGAVGGAQEVTIYGYDGSGPSEPLPYGKPIFQAYQTQLDIPQEDIVHDFEVPKEK